MCVNKCRVDEAAPENKTVEVIGRHGCESEVNNLPNGHKYYCRSVLLSTTVMSTPNKYYLLQRAPRLLLQRGRVDPAGRGGQERHHHRHRDVLLLHRQVPSRHNPCKHNISRPHLLLANMRLLGSQISTRSDMMSPSLIGPIYPEVCRTFDNLTWSHIGDFWLCKGTKYSFPSASSLYQDTMQMMHWQ